MFPEEPSRPYTRHCCQVTAPSALSPVPSSPPGRPRCPLSRTSPAPPPAGPAPGLSPALTRRTQQRTRRRRSGKMAAAVAWGGVAVLRRSRYGYVNSALPRGEGAAAVRSRQSWGRSGRRCLTAGTPGGGGREEEPGGGPASPAPGAAAAPSPPAAASLTCPWRGEGAVVGGASALCPGHVRGVLSSFSKLENKTEVLRFLSKKSVWSCIILTWSHSL